MASHPPVSGHNAASQSVAAPLRSPLLESLYCDMLVLADEVRAGPAPEDIDADPSARIRAACESLRLSARLMRMTQLLLDHRAGRTVPSVIEDSLTSPIGDGPLPLMLVDQLNRAGRLENRLAELVAPSPPLISPVLGMQERLSRHFV